MVRKYRRWDRAKREEYFVWVAWTYAKARSKRRSFDTFSEAIAYAQSRTQAAQLKKNGDVDQ